MLSYIQAVQHCNNIDDIGWNRISAGCMYVSFTCQQMLMWDVGQQVCKKTSHSSSDISHVNLAALHTLSWFCLQFRTVCTYPLIITLLLKCNFWFMACWTFADETYPVAGLTRDWYLLSDCKTLYYGAMERERERQGGRFCVLDVIL